MNHGLWGTVISCQPAALCICSFLLELAVSRWSWTPESSNTQNASLSTIKSFDLMIFRVHRPCTRTTTNSKTEYPNPSICPHNNSNHVFWHTLSLLNFSDLQPRERRLFIYQNSSVVLSAPLRDPSWNPGVWTALSSSGWSIEYRLRRNQLGQEKVWTWW